MQAVLIVLSLALHAIALPMGKQLGSICFHSWMESVVL
jgi:hypothetical protein